ncbi:uncharacterized protein LOC131238632 [Magnolia sinica]|uniref:uncharacterized protein LOC131238632 n=1 Tax=Magnolia sinica TaxID=86752 RepID=UPI002658361D|nr:uncharacterized protein LOC131238632 [Magnolia sinica]
MYLVDSIKDFYSYPWGSLAYNTMSQGVAAAVMASGAVRYNVYGCVFPLQMDPFRMLSTDELKEVEKYYEANKETGEASWFKSIWVDDAWVDSMAIDKYVDFLEERQSDCAIAYP